MVQHLMGLETEYGFSALSDAGEPLPRERLLRRLPELAGQRHPHLPGDRGGIFLGNGSHFYIDHGGHPELCSPECTNPWDLVRYVQAGHRILGELPRELESKTPEIDEILLLRGNVDYGGTMSTWGCHESYLMRSQPDLLADQIVPHLVSRVIYTGTGGFDPTSPGLEFVLSPRSLHIERVSSGSSTRRRGIFHTKDESLCGHGYKRLHVLCGDSVCSETSQWLMIAATALVVAMADAGARPGDGVRLATPLQALRTIARDPHCKAKVRLANGERVTAVAIQRHYLAEVEARLGEDFMPSWAERVVPRWRDTLDRLERAPEELSRTLDWAIKFALFQQHSRSRGMEWEQLSSWTSVLSRIEKTQQTSSPEQDDAPSEVRSRSEVLKRALSERGLRRRDLDRFLALRNELFEIDTRFGQLGEKGVFSRLDRAGVLEHRLTIPDEIEHAMLHPPEGGRARLRGEAVQKLNGGTTQCRCSWQAVWDLDGKRMLDLSDPFETRARWRPIPRKKSSSSTRRDDLLSRLRDLEF